MGYLLSILIGSLIHAEANCQSKTISFAHDTTIRQNGNKFVYLGEHNERFLPNLFHHDYDNPKVMELFTADHLKEYIKGAKLQSPGFKSMRHDLPDILQFLNDHKKKLKWLGVECNPKEFSSYKAFVNDARRLRDIFVSRLEEPEPNKRQDIEDFILAVYGLDIDLAVFHPDAIEGLKVLAVDPDAEGGRALSAGAPLQKEFEGVKEHDCHAPKGSDSVLCDEFNTYFHKIVGDRDLMAIGDIDDMLGSFPDSALKSKMRHALISAEEWVKLNQARDAAVARNISNMDDSGLVIYGKNHVNILPTLESLCKGTKKIKVSPAVGGWTR